MSEMDKTKFTNLLNELRKELLEANTHFEIREKLWPTKETVDILNRYIGFFAPTMDAHFDSFCVKMCNITSNKANQPSFRRILDSIKQNKELAPNLNVNATEEQIKKHDGILQAIKQHQTIKQRIGILI